MQGRRGEVAVRHTLRAFMFLRSMPTSRVTPSPNLRLDAATLRGIIMREEGTWRAGTHLECILFLDGMNGCGKLSELVQRGWDM